MESQASLLRRSDCPYHNSTHAADVLQALCFLLSKGKLHERFEPLEIAAAIIAAVVHDVAHPGVNNAFLDAINVRPTPVSFGLENAWLWHH